MTSLAFGSGLGRGIARLFIAVGFLAAAATGGAQAGEQRSSEEAADFLRGFGDAAIAMLSNARLSEAERQEEFRRLIKTGFELPAISRFVLGKHWHRATEQERSEFTALFEDFVTVTYARRLSSYSGEELKIGNARQASGKGLVLVKSKILRPGQSDIQVDWRLRQSQGAWRIVDLAVEGVSMAQTQRSEFDAVIRRSGGQIGALLQRLRTATEA